MKELQVFDPPYDSDLVDLILALDHLKKKRLTGTTLPPIFFQLKNIFHTLESIGSARIEGNHTTVADFIETKIIIEQKPVDKKDEQIIEIENGEKALRYIDEYIGERKGKITNSFISEVHKIVVQDLTPRPEGKGSKTPGEYRDCNVKIEGSETATAEYTLVPGLMNNLITFIGHSHAEKYDLLKTAIAHHRFTLIHPFDDGNGRTVRLLTYAMLVQQGFNVNVGHILNPTAIFCNHRDIYYEKLARADEETEEGRLEWSLYVLSGLKDEIEKIDKLLNYSYLSEHILERAVDDALERKLITKLESDILEIAIEKEIIQQSDISHLFPGKDPSQISRAIKKLLDQNMLTTADDSQRKYILNFENSYLIRGIITALKDEGFVPESL